MQCEKKVEETGREKDTSSFTNRIVLCVLNVRLCIFLLLWMRRVRCSVAGCCCGRCVHGSFAYCWQIYYAVIIESICRRFSEPKSIVGSQSTQQFCWMFTQGMLICVRMSACVTLCVPECHNIFSVDIVNSIYSPMFCK